MEEFMLWADTVKDAPVNKDVRHSESNQNEKEDHL
jgi:hypothetical protein